MNFRKLRKFRNVRVVSKLSIISFLEMTHPFFIGVCVVSKKIAALREVLRKDRPRHDNLSEARQNGFDLLFWIIAGLLQEQSSEVPF